MQNSNILIHIRKIQLKLSTPCLWMEESGISGEKWHFTVNRTGSRRPEWQRRGLAAFLGLPGALFRMLSSFLLYLLLYQVCKPREQECQTKGVNQGWREDEHKEMFLVSLHRRTDPSCRNFLQELDYKSLCLKEEIGKN